MSRKPLWPDRSPAPSEPEPSFPAPAIVIPTEQLEPSVEDRMRQMDIVPPPKGKKRGPKPKVRALDSIPEIDPWTNNPIYEEGERTKLTLPVKKLSLLHYDKGRGMMSTEGEGDPVYARYLTSLDMDELRMALAEDNSPKAVNFLSHLANPLFASVDITTLAKRCSIGLTEMMQIWRNHKLTAAMGVYIDGAPTLAAHLVEDARSVTVCCGRCDGAGFIKVHREEGTVWIECVNCKGTGVVRRAGDAKARETIFKSIGFVRPDGGNSVSVNINNSQSPTVTSVLDELERLPAVIPATAIPIPDDDA
jgi:hypothetical protein